MASILDPLDLLLTLWNLSRKNGPRLSELPDIKPDQVEIAQTGLPLAVVDIPWPKPGARHFQAALGEFEFES